VIDPEIGFTADVIRDPSRFVGRTELIRDCISAINSSTGLISVKTYAVASGAISILSLAG
jgi:hypothetical protein